MIPVESAKWRAAVVGCGWIGSGVADDPRADGIQAHAAAYAACPDTDLVGVCDANPVRAAGAAKRWGLTAGFQELSELLSAARPQIVSVCTPDSTHAEVLLQVLANSDVRAVIAEKPLALDLAEARRIVDLASSRNIVLAVNYTRRFAPTHIEACRRIKDGYIGSVMAVQGLYTKGVLHNGTHWFDLARWFVGDIAGVQAWPGPTDSQRSDPTCHIRMSFADGQTGFLMGLDEERYTAFEMDIIGTLGRLRMTDSGMKFTWFGTANSRYFSGYRVLESRGEEQAGFKDVALKMVENIVTALRRGIMPQCSGTDGVAAVAVAHAARRSLATGRECAVE